MTETAPQAIPNPLPLRLKEVKEMRDIFLEGIVPVPQSTSEILDAQNAAQSIILEEICAKVMQDFTSPELQREGNFFLRFASTYYNEVQKFESAAWDKLSQSVVSDTSIDLNQLTPLQAATLYLSFTGRFETQAVSSSELFPDLSLHAEVLQKLLQLRDGIADSEVLYATVRRDFPGFLKRLIALDSVISGIYQVTVTDFPPNQPRPKNYGVLPLSIDYFILNANGKLMISSGLLQEMKVFAQKKDIKKDVAGRTENRGCPFLVSKIQDEFIDYAIEEFISQHKKFSGVAGV